MQIRLNENGSHSAADPPKDRYFLGGKTADMIGLYKQTDKRWGASPTIELSLTRFDWFNQLAPNSRFCLPHEFFFSSPHVIALFLLMQKSNEKEKEKKENADGGRI